ncbi:cytochrome P460 family protein [Ferrovibrio xuzhouensis]|uniref:Cytochrome P460 family protein n=1 Tax=Ferrovibrio xuzhouensis TaxID=1576914 RepID=A0ABV7VMI1_9PROT
MQKALNYLAAMLVVGASAGLAVTLLPTGSNGQVANDGNLSPIYGVSIPDGYRQWQLVSVAHEPGFDELRAVLGNPTAMDAYERDALPFPDGTTLVKLAWKHEMSVDFPAAYVAGMPTTVQVMVKDTKKYASTGGWGFGKFIDGKPAGVEEHEACFACHEAHVKNHDFVFTRFSK